LGDGLAHRAVRIAWHEVMVMRGNGKAHPRAGGLFVWRRGKLEVAAEIAATKIATPTEVAATAGVAAAEITAIVAGRTAVVGEIAGSSVSVGAHAAIASVSVGAAHHASLPAEHAVVEPHAGHRAEEAAE